jgi:hypothetical protein
MLKKCFIGYALLSAGFTFGQITLTSVDLPNGGENILTSVTNTLGSSDPALTGANYSWNFSDLAPAFQRPEVFAPQGSYAGSYLNQLYGPMPVVGVPTTYGKDNFTIGLLPVPGFAISSAYDYFKKSSASLKQVGLSYSINDSLPLPFEYTLSDIVYKFPMQYGNSDSCTFKFGPHHFVPSGTMPFYYGGTGKRVNEIDGWGTLVTPFGSFSTLRVKSVITQTDTLFLDSATGGILIPLPQRIEYKWFASGMVVPVLQIDENITGGMPQVTNITYPDSTRAGVPYIGIIEKEAINEFSIYPNPSSSVVSINFNLSAPSFVNITLLNSIGQLNTVIAGKHFAEGKQKLSINVNELNLAPGVYFVNFEYNNGRSIKKLVVTK